MSDFIDGPERELADTTDGRARRRRAAAAMRRRRRRRRRNRALAFALMPLIVAVSAIATVVKLAQEQSKPFADPVKALRADLGAYVVSPLPNLRAGSAGWCAVVRNASSAPPVIPGMGCGPPPAAGGSMLIAGGMRVENAAIVYALVTSEVRSVRFANQRAATRSHPSLPPRWRYAVAAAPSAMTALRNTAAFDAAGRRLPTVTGADAPFVQASSRRVTDAQPARRCAIGGAPGYSILDARVAVGSPRLPSRIEGRAFASCASTIFITTYGRAPLTAAILLDAQRPSARADVLPRVPGLSGRRLGRGWIVVYGSDAPRRAELLRRLKPRA